MQPRQQHDFTLYVPQTLSLPKIQESSSMGAAGVLASSTMQLTP
jgi:hypothetical protein